MKYAFFPGCSLESTAWDFDRSTRAVCRALGIELEDIPDWVCCGSTPAHASNASLAVALPVLNLQKAQAMGLPVMTACASCYARLRTANHKVRNEPDERAARRADHRQALRRRRRGASRARRAGEPLRPGRDPREGRAAAAGLRVACYYGCLLTRPPEIVAFDNPEHPTCMDDLVAARGRAGRVAVQDGVLRGEPLDDAHRRRVPLGPPAAVDGPRRRGPSASPWPARCAR